MRKKPGKLIAGIVLTVVGVAFLSLSGIEGFNQVTFIRNAHSATGVVTKVTYETHGRVAYEKVCVGFKTTENHDIELTSDHDADWGGYYREGDNVPVLYNPLHPSEAQINLFSALWRSLLYKLIIGLLATMSGVSLILYFIKHTPSLAELNPSSYHVTWRDK